MNKRFLTAAVKAADDDDPGSFEAVASAPTLDRDGEVIAPGAFSPLPTTVPIHVDHRMTSEGLVGTGRPFYDGGVLRVRGRFAGTSRAQVIRQLVREGHLGSMSVGFLARKVDRKAEVPTIVEAELLEVSFVTVPSNRESLVTSARGFRDRRYGARHLASMVEVRALVELAELELSELDRTCPARARPSAVDARQALRSAERLLAELRGTR